jgi:hypothetical protein
VETALTNESLQAGSVEALEKANVARTESTRIAKDKFQAGAIDLLPALQLQAAQLAVQAEVSKAESARPENRIQLHLAPGGGWDNRPAACGCASPKTRRLLHLKHPGKPGHGWYAADRGALAFRVRARSAQFLRRPGLEAREGHADSKTRAYLQLWRSTCIWTAEKLPLGVRMRLPLR